jgi:hypothetical protein
MQKEYYMLGRVVVENGVKKLVPLTADCGSGNPCGAIITVYQRTVPNGYLPLGAQYDIIQFPVLYSILGTDTIPTASALGLPTLTTGQYVIKATSGINENQADNVLSALSPVNTVANGNMHSVTSNAVYPIKEKTDKMYVDNQLELVRYLPYLSWQSLPSQSSDDNVYFKEWIDYMYDNHYFDGEDSATVFIGQANPNYRVMVWGYTYGGTQAKVWSAFRYISPANGIGRFGYYNGSFYCDPI